MKHYRLHAFTIIQALVALAIASIVFAILTPVYLSVRRTNQISASLSKQRQLFVSLTLYRVDYDGIDGVYEYYALGLPTAHYYFHTLFALPLDAWSSPCGYDPELHETGLSTFKGYITYAAPYYEPTSLLPPPLSRLDNYLSFYRDNSVVFVDVYCNKPGQNLRDPSFSKRALATLLNGTQVNRTLRGSAAALQFYSDPPQN